MTAWTIPARSGQDRVKIYSAPLVATFGTVDAILFCDVPAEVALLMLVMMLDWRGRFKTEMVGRIARLGTSGSLELPFRSVFRDVLPSNTLLAVDIRAAKVFFGQLSHNIRLCG